MCRLPMVSMRFHGQFLASLVRKPHTAEGEMQIKRFHLGLWTLWCAAMIFPAMPGLARPGAEGLAITSPGSPLPSATVGVAYAPVTFLASGGTGGYTWSQTGLPATTGMALSSGGALSGTPVIGSEGPYTL